MIKALECQVLVSVLEGHAMVRPPVVPARFLCVKAPEGQVPVQAPDVILHWWGLMERTNCILSVALQ